MAKFVMVDAFTRGVLADSDATVINVEQITHFYERTLKMPNGDQPVVHCDINGKGSMMLDCSMAEFVELLRTVAN